MAEKRKEERTRNWAFLVYPDSVNENWVDELDEMHLRCAISPLHDKDTYTADVVDKDSGEVKHKKGELKKPHHHVIVVFDSVKAYSQVQEICRRIGANEVPKRLYDLKASLRYLCHLDNPKKAPYSIDDVVTLGGMEYGEEINSDKERENEVSSEVSRILNLSAEHELWNFAAMADFLVSEEPELFTCLRKNAYFFGTYFKTKHVIPKRWEPEPENVNNNLQEST